MLRDVEMQGIELAVVVPVARQQSVGMRASGPLDSCEAHVDESALAIPAKEPESKGVVIGGGDVSESVAIKIACDEFGRLAAYGNPRGLAKVSLAVIEQHGECTVASSDDIRHAIAVHVDRKQSRRLAWNLYDAHLSEHLREREQSQK